MAIIKGQSYRVKFYVWKKSDLTPYTGSASAITVWLRRDNQTIQTATGTVEAEDTTYAPGSYLIELSNSEMDGNVISVYPSISDTNYQCQYVTLYTERGRIDANIGSRATPADIANTPVTLTGAEHDQIAADVTVGLDAYGYTTARAAKLDNLDAAVSSRAAPGDILATPANKLATDANGRVTAASVASDVTISMTQALPATPTADTVGDALKSAATLEFSGTNVKSAPQTNVTVGGYAAGQSPAEQVLSTPANKLATDASGRVTVGTNADKSNYTLATTEHTSIASAVWNFIAEGTYTMLNIMRLVASALFGKVSGAQTNQPVFRDILDTKNRISMTTDNDGNRTSVTLDGD